MQSSSLFFIQESSLIYLILNFSLNLIFFFNLSNNKIIISAFKLEDENKYCIYIKKQFYKNIGFDFQYGKK